MEIQKYDPQLAVCTFDGIEILVPEKLKDKLYNDVQKLKFIEINGELINTSSIKKIIKAPKMGKLQGLKQSVRDRVKARIEEFKNNLGRYPSDSEIDRFILKAEQSCWN